MIRIARSLRRGRLLGATLPEILVASAIAASITGVSLGVLKTGRDTFQVGAISASARAQATATLDALASRLEECGVTTASIAPADANGGPYLTAQRCTGVVGTTIQWGPPITFCYMTASKAASSPMGGGKVAIGPGELVLESGPEKNVLGSSLAKDGFSATLSGSVATIQITIEKAVPGHTPIRVTAERKIHLSN